MNLDLCGGWGWGGSSSSNFLCLLCWPLLGLQHLGLDGGVVLEDGTAPCSLGVGVQFHHDLQVLKRILLQNSAVDLLVGCTKCLLDLLALQDSAQVGVGHLVHWQIVVVLDGGALAPGAVQLIKLAESTLSPDAEAPNVTTRGEPQEVQFVDVLQGDAWNISEGFGDTGILVVDDARSFALDTSTIPHLTLTGTHTLGGIYLFDIIPSLQLFQQKHGLLGLLVSFNFVINHQWDLRDLLNAVPFGHDKGRQGRGSQSRADGITLLVGVDPAVPAAPSLGGCKHTTSATHISKSSLARAVGTTSPHTGNTGNSSSCSPGLSTRLVSGQLADGIWLTVVLAHIGMHKVHNIGPNRRLEHGWHDNILARRFSLLGINRNQGTGASHI